MINGIAREKTRKLFQDVYQELKILSYQKESKDGDVHIAMLITVKNVSKLLCFVKWAR